MKKSFSKNKEEENVVDAEVEETAVATQEEAQVEQARKVLPTTSRGFSAVVTTEDIETPYLSLVGKTGDLSDEFEAGSFVYNKQLEVCSKKDSFNITLIGFERIYVEDIPFGEEGTPAKFKDINEAFAQGFHTDWDRKDDGKYLIQQGNAIVLLEVDEELSEFSHDGKHYALAAWTLKKTGWTNAGKKMFNACRKGWLSKAVHLGTWEISSKYETGGEFKYYHPVAKKGELHNEEFLQFLEDEVLPN